MPSKKSLELTNLKVEINILNKKINDQIPLQEIKNITVQKKKNNSYGLLDLIAGKTPTFLYWTNNPTDAANITDGNTGTFCTTGNRVCAGGWQFAIFEWDLGGTYNIITTGFGAVNATAGNPCAYLEFYINGSWRSSASSLLSSSTIYIETSFGAQCSKVRLQIASTAAATVSPNIGEFNVWKLK